MVVAVVILLYDLKKGDSRAAVESLRLVVAYGQGPQAVKAAELAEQEHTLALKEGEQ